LRDFQGFCLMESPIVQDNYLEQIGFLCRELIEEYLECFCVAQGQLHQKVFPCYGGKRPKEIG
jgi:hypothetical protein